MTVSVTLLVILRFIVFIVRLRWLIPVPGFMLLLTVRFVKFLNSTRPGVGDCSPIKKIGVSGVFFPRVVSQRVENLVFASINGGRSPPLGHYNDPVCPS